MARLSGMMVEQARHFDSLAVSAPNRLVVTFRPEYAVFKSACSRPEQTARFERALAEASGRQIFVEFAVAEAAAGEAEPPARLVPSHQRLLEAAKNPLVRRAAELFGAQPIQVDVPNS